ncbi:FGGY-family carbohydrate kinase [Vacuolonema iberomarrocanum]|uniref:FGGY-family carbohydrate kinase n=1 Tax=Vacuolonema iberomarrocanum TaxID=3454632 RepID=UPI0019F405C5|nr:FGGY-family carbohydrate kinase [filamentous cyanobacterium LEGE 07170]
MHYWLGVDFGTSGARAIAINPEAAIVAQTQCSLDTQQPTLWQTALWTLLDALPPTITANLVAIAINGTSSTLLFCDERGVPLSDPLLYNDDRGKEVLEEVRAIAPSQPVVGSATSSFAKLLWWEQTIRPKVAQPSDAPIYLMHQADWLSFLLHGAIGISDYHNALKLGYDVGTLRYPDWLVDSPARPSNPATALTKRCVRASKVVLPQVRVPGEAIAPLRPALAQRFGIAETCKICAGTTDSIAAFLASGARSPGDAVTSLGSTLALKLLSNVRVDEARYGLYSHRLGKLWLVGGASNTGGAVLRQFFDAAELEHLSQRIDPQKISPFTYYPLTRPGERFPINDPHLEPQLEPRPEDPAEFLHGILEAIARIESLGYQRLQELGATPLRQVYTAGGGAQNEPWMVMRSRCLQVPVCRSPQTEAAYGTAWLAQNGVIW